MPAKIRLVGERYVGYLLAEIFGYAVHHSSVQSLVRRKGFPKEYYSDAERENAGIAQRLWRQDRVQEFVEHAIDNGFQARPARDIKRSFGGNVERPSI